MVYQMQEKKIYSSFTDKTPAETIKILETTEKGLTHEESIQRLHIHGPNQLKEKKKISPLLIFFRQFHSIVVYILIIAVVISFIVGEYLDAEVIIGILIFNAFFGFIQEYKAEESIAALKKLTSLKAKVIRDGEIHEVDAATLVPGDLLLLEEGDKIPADCRIIESIHLKTLESALTGESKAIEKIVNPISGTVSLGDQKNIVFSGTVITSGRGKGVVSATGMNTEIGKIAKMLETAEETETPLQKNLNKIGKVLGYGTIIVCIIVFLVTVMKGQEFLPAFLASVALAVAAIPEGLPAVITISLGIGIQRMIKKNALIRKLSSVETLGCTTVICTDKTGTLTKNEMTVRKLYFNSKVIEVTGAGYKQQGEFFIHGKKIDPKECALLLKIGALNNNAHIDNEKIIGDPTEGALLVSAAKAGIFREQLEKEEPRCEELVFDSERKRMSTVHLLTKKHVMYTKGAPDIILHLCDRIFVNGKIRKITESDKKNILEAIHSFSAGALRVLGFAYKEVPATKKCEEHEENNLVFVGLQGMIDPPRPEAKDAIQKCHDAGIRIIMITGDHASTAKAIGEELGIGTRVMEGTELAAREHLDDDIDHIDIFARVNPEHKLKIVHALQKKGHVVAMTGDGVNDAPALKQADIGVAMGITGTDVSKEASDMILTDDNFASIVNAVEEGRGIYGNIKKYFRFLLCGNISEVLIVFTLTLFGFPLPLLATQILLINLITDGFPALALSVDPFEPNAMKQKPRKKEEKLYNHLWPYLTFYPLTITLAAYLIFSFYYTPTNYAKAQTMVFLLISTSELFQAFSCRSTLQSAFSVGLLKNHYLLGAIAFSAGIIAAVVYIPFFHPLFGTTSLAFVELGSIVLIASSGFIVLELIKWMQKVFGNKNPNRRKPMSLS